MQEFPEKELPEELKDFSFDDLDFDLMTFGECSMLISDELNLDKLILKRAEELGFNPDFLTDEQIGAVVFCMNPEELGAFRRPMEIALKNHRLKKKLSKEDRSTVEIHVRNTKIFGNLDSIESEEKKHEILEVLTNEVAGVLAFLYFTIMQHYNERMFEGLFDFLPKEYLDSAKVSAFLWLEKNGIVKWE